MRRLKLEIIADPNPKSPTPNMILYSIDRDDLGTYVYEIQRRVQGGWIEMDGFRLVSIDGHPPGEISRTEGEEFFDAALPERIDGVNRLLAEYRPMAEDRAFELATGR